MGFSDEQVRKIVALKDDLYAQISGHREKIEVLEGNLEVLDMILKESSFTKASSLVAGQDAGQSPEKDAIPITNGSGGEVIARAHVTPEQVSIVLDGGTEVSAETPPFKSFFLDRIIDGMRRKDASEVDAGKIEKESVIHCTVNKNGPHIREIVVRNYRQKGRVNEIINTAGWSLARMLENVKK